MQAWLVILFYISCPAGIWVNVIPIWDLWSFRPLLISCRASVQINLIPSREIPLPYALSGVILEPQDCHDDQQERNPWGNGVTPRIARPSPKYIPPRENLESLKHN